MNSLAMSPFGSVQVEVNEMFTGIEGGKNRAGKRDLDGAFLDHVHAIIFYRALFGAAFAAVPFHCACEKLIRHVGRHAIAVVFGTRARQPDEVAQAIAGKSAIHRLRFDFRKILPDRDVRISIQFGMGIRQYQIDRGAIFVGRGHAMRERVYIVEAFYIRIADVAARAFAPIKQKWQW